MGPPGGSQPAKKKGTSNREEASDRRSPTGESGGGERRTTRHRDARSGELQWRQPLSRCGGGAPASGFGRNTESSRGDTTADLQKDQDWRGTATNRFITRKLKPRAGRRSRPSIFAGLQGLLDGRGDLGRKVTTARPRPRRSDSTATIQPRWLSVVSWPANTRPAIEEQMSMSLSAASVLPAQLVAEAGEARQDRRALRMRPAHTSSRAVGEQVPREGVVHFRDVASEEQQLKPRPWYWPNPGSWSRSSRGTR